MRFERQILRRICGPFTHAKIYDLLPVVELIVQDEARAVPAAELTHGLMAGL